MDSLLSVIDEHEYNKKEGIEPYLEEYGLMHLTNALTYMYESEKNSKG